MFSATHKCYVGNMQIVSQQLGINEKKAESCHAKEKSLYHNSSNPITIRHFHQSDLCDLIIPGFSSHDLLEKVDKYWQDLSLKLFKVNFPLSCKLFILFCPLSTDNSIRKNSRNIALCESTENISELRVV